MATEPRRRDLPRADMRAVELVETDAGTAPALVPAPTPHARAPRTRSLPTGSRRDRPCRRARWALACLVALLPAPAAGEVAIGDPSGVAQTHGDGVLAPLSGPVAAAWSRAVSLWPGAVVVGGVVLGVENLPGGGTDVIALDADTGATVWRALPSEADGQTLTLQCAAGTPRGGEHDPRPTVACLVAQRTVARVDQHTEQQVVTLDVATGDVLARGAVGIAPAGRAGVLPAEPADARTEGRAPTIGLTTAGALVASDGAGGPERWRLEGPFFPDLLLVVGTRVLVADATTVAGVERADGARLWTARVRRVPGALLLTDGHLVLTTVDGPDGRDLVALGVDDGRARWTSPLADDLRAVVLGDRLYGLGSERLVALR